MREEIINRLNLKPSTFKFEDYKTTQLYEFVELPGVFIGMCDLNGLPSKDYLIFGKRFTWSPTRDQIEKGNKNDIFDIINSELYKLNN